MVDSGFLELPLAGIEEVHEVLARSLDLTDQALHKHYLSQGIRLVAT